MANAMAEECSESLLRERYHSLIFPSLKVPYDPIKPCWP
jgi:hypothetical protein